jgi:hypothetical protein
MSAVQPAASRGARGDASIRQLLPGGSHRGSAPNKGGGSLTLLFLIAWPTNFAAYSSGGLELGWAGNATRAYIVHVTLPCLRLAHEANGLPLVFLCRRPSGTPRVRGVHGKAVTPGSCRQHSMRLHAWNRPGCHPGQAPCRPRTQGMTAPHHVHRKPPACHTAPLSGHTGHALCQAQCAPSVRNIICV